MLRHISKYRYKQLRWLWENETNDPETQEYRQETTYDEDKLLEVWDKEYSFGQLRVAEAILALEANRVVERSPFKVQGGPADV